MTKTLRTGGPQVSAATPHAPDTDQHGADGEDACCRGLGPGQTCPLHKHRKSSTSRASASSSHHEASAKTAESAETSTPRAARRPCEVRAACNPSNAAPVPVMFEAGIVPAAFVLLHTPTTAAVPDLTTVALLRAERPDSPPPRG